MGKVTKCLFFLFDKSEIPVYRPGDSVIGNILLEVEGEISVNAVRLSCLGASLTKWRPLFTGAHASDPRAKESYLNRDVVLAGGKGTLTLTSGSHTYPFCFDLPSDSLPSSYEGEQGAVRYWLSLRVDKKFPGIDFVRSKTVTVLSDLNIGISTYQKSIDSSCFKTLSKFLGVGNAGELHLAASLDKRGYCPGEKVVINLEARNESSKDCGKVRAKLMQKAFYTVGEDTDTNRTTITNVTKSGDEVLKKGEKIVWNKIQFTIPAVPPTTKLRSCHNIKVDYYVKLEIEVASGFDLELCLPITIGTIPAGVTKSVKKLQSKDGRIYNRVSFSPLLNHKQCTRGFELCHKTDTDLPFPDLASTPYTVFHDGSSTTAQTGDTKVTTPPLKTASVTAAPKVTTPTPKTASVTAPPKVTPTAPPMDQSSGNKIVPAWIPGPTSEETLPKYSATDPRAPVLEAPPSYDSIFTPSASTGADASQGACAAAVAVPSEEWKGVALGLVFPESQLARMVDHMNTYGRNLASSNGVMLGVLDKFPIFSFKPSSSIFVVFPCEKSAMSWFDHFQWTNPCPDIHVLFAENTVAYPRPMDPKLYPYLYTVISYKTGENDLTKDEIKEYAQLSKILVNPLREKFGGKNIISSSKVRFVSGDWSVLPCTAKDLNLIIHHWPSRDHFIKYTNTRKQHHDYPRFNELSSRKRLTSVHAETTLNTSSDMTEGNQFWRGAVLCLAFSPQDKSKVVDYFKADVKSLTEANGRVLALFDEFLMSPPSSSHVSAIIVLFPSESSAKLWFRTFQTSGVLAEVKVFYAENYIPKDKPTSSKLYPAISLTMSFKTSYVNDGEKMKIGEMSKSMIVPIRERFGGKLFLVANAVKFLSGDWSTELPYAGNDVNLVITQWASMEHHEAYLNEVKAHPDYSKYDDLTKKFFSERRILVTVFKEDELIGVRPSS